MNTTSKKDTVSDSELKKVIADFLEMGHVENIVAMFRRHPRYYNWTGELLDDDRFNVRLGLSVLFEELKDVQPEKTPLAVPSLLEALKHQSPLIRGEAISILGIIGTEEALSLVHNMLEDKNPQVREIAGVILDDFSPANAEPSPENS